MKIVPWTVTMGAVLLAACSQQEGANNSDANKVMGLPPANLASPNEPQNLADSGNMNASEETTRQTDAPAENRMQAAPKAPSQGSRAAPRERPAEPVAQRPAPKQEPSPAPTPVCTPEHAAMGHCKQ
jgi:outer membrane biosynthesis protein TonB